MQGIDETTNRTDHGTAVALQPASGAQPAAAHTFGRGSLRLHAARARLLGKESLRFTDKVRLAYWNAFQHDCLNTAKAAAYSAIFAIFPALIVFAALVTFLPYAAPLRSQLAIFFNRVLPAVVAPVLEHYFLESHATRESATVVLGTVAVSVSGAAGVLGTLMEGFRRAYGLLDESWGTGWRGQLRRYLWSLLLVPISLVPLAIASILIIFGHFLLPALQHVLPLAMDRTFILLAVALRWTVSVLVTVAVLAGIFRYGLPVRPPWPRVLPGAIFATFAWFLSTLGFGWYVTHLGNYSRTYGSLGTGVVLLLWLFLTAFTVLCGAELNAELSRDA